MKTIYHEKPWLKFYPPEAPAEVDVPVISLAEAFDQAANRWGKKTAIIYYGREISFVDLKDQVDRFANALSNLGIKKGDTVAILLLNCPQYLIAYYAAFKVGATVTLINPMYVSPEIKHQLEDSDARSMICLSIFYDAVEKSGVKLKNVILTDIGEYLPRMKKFLGKSVLGAIYQKMALPSPQILAREGFYQLQDLIKKYPPRPPQIEIDPKEDIATLQYTGGTTGLPKAAMLTHYNFIANEQQTNSFLRGSYQDGREVIAAYMPFYHAAGQLYMTQGLLHGHTLVIATTADLDDLLRDIENYQITGFVGAPTIYDLLKNYEKTDQVNWKRLRYVGSGADALLEDTARGWERRTGVKICEGYGMSEAVCATHVNPPKRIKPGSFGVPLPSFQSAILHPEKDEFMPQGEIGEIAIIGPSVMKGYWKSPEENAGKFAKIDDEVWMRTGDIGRMDEEGYFYFYDRKRDMIKYKGHGVFAKEVEDVIKNHPGVKEVGVVGVRDPAAGEVVKAVVVLESDARGKISEEDIVAYCNGKLAHFKIPKIIEFRGEIPKTDVGKVSRRELREEA